MLFNVSHISFAALAAAAVAVFTIPQNPEAKAAAPVTASVDVGNGVFVVGTPAIVKVSFTNHTNTRQKLDAALVAGIGTFLMPAGTPAKPVMDDSAFGKEPAFEIPPGGSVTCSIDISSQVAMHAGKVDSGSVMFDAKGITSTPAPVELVEDLSKTLVVVKTNFGVLKFKVDSQHAPLGARNFVRLVKSGYYDGSRFHRVLKGFMAQAGDPNSKDNDDNNDGQGGATYNGKPLPAEITDVKHIRGTLSYARNGDPAAQTHQMAIQMLRMMFSKSNPDPKYATQRLEELQKDGFFRDRKPFLDSAGSQFFICFGPTPQLDGGYTPFGNLVEGDDVLKAIEEVGAANDGDGKGRPKKEIKVESATLEIAK